MNRHIIHSTTGAAHFLAAAPRICMIHAGEKNHTTS
jgi:hypothetical protein